VAVAAHFKKNFSHVHTQILAIDVFWYGNSELPTVGQCSQSDHKWWSMQDVGVWGMVVSLCAEGYIVISIQITIKDKAMAVWYFSHSYSVMSKSFDFTKVFIDPIHVSPSWMIVSQTLFGHISINSSTISKTMESPQKDLLIDASHVLGQSILAGVMLLENFLWKCSMG